MRVALGFTLWMLVGNPAAAEADGEPNGHGSPGAPDVRALARLRGASTPRPPANAGTGRIRDTAAVLPPQARTLHEILARGGQLSLAGGPLVVEVDVNGHLRLIGSISAQWVQADSALRYGGQLIVDDGVVLLVANEHLDEVRIRDGETVYVLTPPTGRTVRAVGVFRERFTPAPPPGALVAPRAVPPATVEGIDAASPFRISSAAAVATANANRAEAPHGPRNSEPREDELATAPPESPLNQELDEIAEIEAKLREAQRLHTTLLGVATRPTWLGAIADELARLDVRVASLWREADEVIRVSHRAVRDDPSSGTSAARRSAARLFTDARRGAFVLQAQRPAVNE